MLPFGEIWSCRWACVCARGNRRGDGRRNYWRDCRADQSFVLRTVETFGRSGSEESELLKSAGEPSCESLTVKRLDKMFRTYWTYNIIDFLFANYWFVLSTGICILSVLTLPYLTFGVGAKAHQRWGHSLGPMLNVQPRQTSRSKKSLRGFCKPQESCPVDTIKSVQWECVITEDRSSE